MLLMFDGSGNRVIDWKLGKKFIFPKDIDAVDINTCCASDFELEFITSIISGLVYPKSHTSVWWYAGTAKTVASILEAYPDIVSESAAFVDRKRKIDGAKAKVGAAFDKVRGFKIG